MMRNRLKKSKQSSWTGLLLLAVLANAKTSRETDLSIKDESDGKAGRVVQGENTGEEKSSEDQKQEWNYVHSRRVSILTGSGVGPAEEGLSAGRDGGKANLRRSHKMKSLKG